MRVHVAFTPEETLEADVAVVVDVMRATSVIAQALASGYERILCCADIDEARAVRDSLEEPAVLAGERNAVLIPGFDVGASPREFLEASEQPLILSTTNGTRAILTAASRCGAVLLGSLLNLDAAASAARANGGDVTIVCSGFHGRFAIDDAYCAGRIAELLGGTPTDATVASRVVAAAFPDALDGLNARTYGPPGLEQDLAWCAQVNTLDVVPRFVRMVGGAAEIAV